MPEKESEHWFYKMLKTPLTYVIAVTAINAGCTIYFVSKFNHILSTQVTSETIDPFYTAQMDWLNVWMVLLTVVLAIMAVALPYIFADKMEKQRETFEKIKEKADDILANLKKFDKDELEGNIEKIQKDLNAINEMHLDDKIDQIQQSLKENQNELQNLKEERKKAQEDAKTYQLFYQGNQSAQEGRYYDAIESFNKAIEIKPNYSPAYGNLGLALLELGKQDEAIQALDKAIELNPKEPIFYFNKGNALQEKKEYQKAIETYDKAIEINSNYEGVHGNKGNALLEIKEYQKAIEAYDKVIQINPKDDKAYFNKGIAYTHLDKLEEAIKAYEETLKIAPNRTDAYISICSLYYRLGDLNRAINCLNELHKNIKSPQILKERKKQWLEILDKSPQNNEIKELRELIEKLEEVE